MFSLGLHFMQRQRPATHFHNRTNGSSAEKHMQSVLLQILTIGRAYNSRERTISPPPQAKKRPARRWPLLRRQEWNVGHDSE